MAEGLLTPTRRLRAPKRSAGGTTAILLAHPSALLTRSSPTGRGGGSSPPSTCKLPAHRLPILLGHRLTAKEAARGPIWALEALDPGRWTPGKARHENRQLTRGRRATNQGSCRTGHWVCKHDEEKSLPKEAERQTFVPAPQEHRGLQNFTRVEGRR